MIDESVTVSRVHLLLVEDCGIDRGQQLPHRAIMPQPFRRSALTRCDALLSSVGENDHARRANLTPPGREVVDIGDYEGVRRPLFNVRDVSGSHDVDAGIVESFLEVSQAYGIGFDEYWMRVRAKENHPRGKVFEHGTPLRVANARWRKPAVLVPRWAAARTLMNTTRYRKGLRPDFAQICSQSRRGSTLLARLTTNLGRLVLPPESGAEPAEPWTTRYRDVSDL